MRASRGGTGPGKSANKRFSRTVREKAARTALFKSEKAVQEKATMMAPQGVAETAAMVDYGGRDFHGNCGIGGSVGLEDWN